MTKLGAGGTLQTQKTPSRGTNTCAEAGFLWRSQLWVLSVPCTVKILKITTPASPALGRPGSRVHPPES